MKIVLLGAGPLTVMTARLLTEAGHDAVIIEEDKQRIEELSGDLDCGFIHGDGAHPAILRETEPGENVWLFCLTNNDQANILASLVGRSLGFGRVVTRIEDPEFEHICRELGLTDVLVPDRHVAATLAAMVKGTVAEDFGAFFKADVRLFSFVVRAEEAGPTADLDLPEDARMICIYRGEDSITGVERATLRIDDEVVLITPEKNLKALRERWSIVGSGQ